MRPGNAVEDEERALRAARKRRFVATGHLTLTPGAVPAQMGGDYGAVCARLGLVPQPAGWTVFQCQEHDGARWTVIMSGTERLDTYAALRDLGIDARLFLDDTESGVHAVRPGWVVGHGDACPLLPAPYDPPGASAPLWP